MEVQGSRWIGKCPKANYEEEKKKDREFESVGEAVGERRVERDGGRPRRWKRWIHKEISDSGEHGGESPERSDGGEQRWFCLDRGEETKTLRIN
ncbi:hypothetical protein L2E82_07879 [Cichorium intybus]|uniref:Uncharacterized protein n=1 Tax=Cichorium intybus TaxID=13427 RepID=A0ACB9G527_CICIN|nr:hypothetical protein L2E82_07879 [Cichorium intybus]